MTVELPNSHSWVIESSHVDASYRVDLAVPERATDRPVPVVVVLDGSAMFLSATEFARTVTRVTLGELPPVAVVGVTCLTPDHLAYVSARFRDFTPVAWEPHGPFADDVAMMGHGSGGASAFLSTVVDEVLPRVGDVVEVDGERLAVCGWSLSGLFAAFAWRERPDVFSRLLAISPSLWWADAAILSEPVPVRPAGHRAFVCAGELEEGDPSRVWPQRFANGAQREMAAMVRNAATFAEMCATAGAATTHVTFADEHHITVHSAGLARGLVTLFAD
jgi:predicted alpha/beta superfamily hydrolase